MLGYLNELNRGGKQRRGTSRSSAMPRSLPGECLRPMLRPASAGLAEVLEALGGEDVQLRLLYLEEQLKIIQRAHPGSVFSSHPLAEYLAALHLVHVNRDDASLWRAFLDQAAIALAERETVSSFLLARRILPDFQGGCGCASPAGQAAAGRESGC